MKNSNKKVEDNREQMAEQRAEQRLTTKENN